MNDVLEAFDFRLVVEQSDVGICIVQDDVFQYVNPKFCAMHGWSEDELIGGEVMRVVHGASRAQVAEVRRLRELGRHAAPYETRHVRSDGSSFDARIFGRAIVHRGRRASLTTVSDISELVTVNRVADARARMIASTEQLSQSGSFELVNGTGRVRTSEGARAMLGVGEDWREAPLRRVLRAVHPEDRLRTINHWRSARPDKPFEFSHRLLRADGGVLRVLHRALLDATDGAEILRPIAILQNVTESTAAKAQIERLVNYHPVTGLATRRLLLLRANLAVQLALGESRPLALLYLRVQALERVDDALGAEASESLASTLAGRLLSHCRPEDTVAHLGRGDFVVLLDPTAGADQTQALHMATRIVDAFAEPVAVDATEVVSGAQVGVALYPDDAASASELLDHARAACGRVGAGGGSGVSFFTRAAGDSAGRRIRLEAALRRAFERGELSLGYQPQLNLRTGRIVGVEALLRWSSAEFGEVSPAEFVPIAEEAGLIVPIGEWVFRSACEQSVAWAKEGLPSVRIGVNLSPIQLDQPDISRRLQSVLIETGADPMRMGIEITESVLMRDLERARRTLEELSAIGIEIALDDFGTGYSNLSVLRALPFDVLKIDRSLVHDVTAAPEDVSITRAVLMLAQGLKLKVLAEGVETEGQLNLLISNGCELMQGFIFSKPVAADEIATMLREGRCLPEHYLDRTVRERTLLLVDDEDSVVSALRRVLRGAGYRILTARSGPEGLARLAEHPVDVIVSDQRMPGMTGVEFLRRAKELYPETVRIVLSGYTELQSITDAVNEGAIYKFFTKPWDDDLLRAHVAEAFRRKELDDENQRLSSEVRSANRELAQVNERQEKLLARQREQLSLEEVRALNAQDLLEHLPVAVIGIDIGGTIAFVNRDARALMRTVSPLVGCAAGDVLPADWVEAWHAADGRHRAARVDGRPCMLSCAPLNDSGAARGHLLSIVPVPEACLEIAA